MDADDVVYEFSFNASTGSMNLKLPEINKTRCISTPGICVLMIFFGTNMHRIKNLIGSSTIQTRQHCRVSHLYRITRKVYNGRLPA